MSQLPQGWEVKKFTDVFDINGGTQPPKSEFISEPKEGYIRLLQIRDFGAKPVPTYIPDNGKRRICTENDILIGRYGASVGRICTGMSGAYNVALAKVAKPDYIDTGYLKYFLKSDVFQRPLSMLSRSAQNGFNKKDLSTFDFYQPPLEDQKRIADKLDTVLAKVEAAQARLDKIPTILKRFRQSVLAAATSGELTKDWREENESIQSAFEAYELKRLSDRKKWEEIKLSEFREKNKFPSNDKWKAKYKEVALPNQEELQPLNSGWGYFYVENVASSAKYSMSSGPFGSALGRKDYTEAGVPVLRGQNVKNGVAGVGGFVFVSEEKATSIPRSLAYPGDVVVVAVGSSGVTGIIPQNISVALLSQNCNKISVDNVLVRSEYFNLFLQSQVAQSQISAQTTDTVRQFFSLTNLKKTVIAVPPLQEQNEILLRVEELFEHANTVEKQYNAAKARLDKLTQSILAKAFRGELIK
jgi:type I restriction enzyme S subunit